MKLIHEILPPNFYLYTKHREFLYSKGKKEKKKENSKMFFSFFGLGLQKFFNPVFFLGQHFINTLAWYFFSFLVSLFSFGRHMHGGALLSLIGVKHLTLTSWFFFFFFFSPLFGSSCVFQIFDNNFTLANPSIHICHRKAHWAASLTEAQFPPKGRSLQTKSTILPFLCPLSMFDCFQILLFIFSVFLFLCPRKEKNEKHTESVTHTHTAFSGPRFPLSLSKISLYSGRGKRKRQEWPSLLFSAESSSPPFSFFPLTKSQSLFFFIYLSIFLHFHFSVFFWVDFFAYYSLIIIIIIIQIKN